jgi:hypothetical protein
MVIDTRNRSESKPHEKPRGVLALMQMAIWILFRHNRTFIIQLSSSEMILMMNVILYQKKSHPSSVIE